MRHGTRIPGTRRMNGRRLSRMGVVYRAVDLNLGREVAIKVLPDAILHDPERRNRLLHEARAASTLEHPHIAVIHEVGDDNGVTFIAMELIRGEKLSDVVRRAPLPLGRALTLAIEIAEGLGRAHDKGIVHRDLKPGNVMLTDEGHAKVIDFGLAKVIEPIDSAAATISVTGPRTESGVVLGTAAYMSPEQARGGRVDHRSDIFALGVTLYETGIPGRVEPRHHARDPLPAGATAARDRRVCRSDRRGAADHQQVHREGSRRSFSGHEGPRRRFACDQAASRFCAFNRRHFGAIPGGGDNTHRSPTIPAGCDSGHPRRGGRHRSRGALVERQQTVIEGTIGDAGGRRAVLRK